VRPHSSPSQGPPSLLLSLSPWDRPPPKQITLLVASTGDPCALISSLERSLQPNLDVDSAHAAVATPVNSLPIDL
jgi:hypothetical protein